MSTRPHAFVAMPFGPKPGPGGAIIDFNRVFKDLIAPAIEAAGLSGLRADEEIRAGDIRTDMFQELLLADLVVVDLTIDNPNVWYELGVRHALRARGVVLLYGALPDVPAPKAFDVYTDRKLRYSLKDGGPDPATLDDDRRRLTEMIRATMEAWHGRKVSPVYSLMPNLQEPDWRELKLGAAAEFWQQHEAWAGQIDLARREGRIGDMLVLADEAPVTALRAEAWLLAGKALRRAGQFALALEYLERALAVNPDALDALREKGMCLERLALAGTPEVTLARAEAHYREVLERFAHDTETQALLGRVDKMAWVARWRTEGRSPEQMREEAAYADALLHAAIEGYAAAYRRRPSHYFSGINALTLVHLARHLGVAPEAFADADGEREAALMAGAVRFAARHETDEGQRFWSLATLGDLAVLDSAPADITRAYKRACAEAQGDWFALDSCRSQLKLLQDLGFRPEAVAAGLAVFERELAQLQRPAGAAAAPKPPRQVLLFSGHMVDAPERATPRFPASAEAKAAEAIARTLDQLQAGPEDLALCQAAAGGDLLFLEACQQRGVRCRVLLPFAEPEYIQRSVLPSAGGAAWRDRFYAAKGRLAEPIRQMAQALGPLPPGVDPFERCNLWLLHSAQALGIDRVRCIVLWNGSGGDGPGGTAHMVREVRRHTGQVFHLDTRALW